MPKIVITLVIIFTAILTGYTQPSLNYESEAVKYFSQKILGVDERLQGIMLTFPKTSMGKPTEVFHLADALGDIQALKPLSDEQQRMIDSCENVNQALPKELVAIPKIKAPAMRSVTDRYSMSVYNKILYKNAYYVEIYLLNKRHNKEKFIFVKFDNGAPVGFFLRSFIVD
ncbi:hypothetical protein [Mucilaginibacter myungsuensis]|uniref:Uncharacterized protein n=1 Tax=Mucilaginibacter myungsuensis TaxID=649104 RepID=A0A929KZG1_9SPHI|nr:hypothetical protein [Mucilaginibacter myungsuensis]MBE9664032.1 hypothetical protein [Mucilaginibacter myungsuensis]MDN3601211.1 hypothetical protein [Mucilaginibacter myungsuensis]